MTYKGMEYKIIQMIGSNGWTWSFQPDGSKPIHGTAKTRALAVLAAERAIDKRRAPTLDRSPKERPPVKTA